MNKFYFAQHLAYLVSFRYLHLSNIKYFETSAMNCQNLNIRIEYYRLGLQISLLVNFRNH